MNKKLIGYLVFFAALVLIFWWALSKYTPMFSQSKLAKRGSVQAFSFVDQDGKVFSNANMIGKVCVIEYFFTTCTGICPRMNNNMDSVYEAFKDEPEFLIVAHTCKPEQDSVAQLKAFATSRKINTAKWVLLTGKKDSLYKMARFSYGIDDPQNAVADINDDFIHTQFFALVDKNGIVRGQVYDGLKKEEIEKMKADIKDLLKEKAERSHFVNGVFTNNPN